MNGVDAIIFTAGIGENDNLVREDICSYFKYLGVAIDLEANKKRGEDIVISTPDSKVKVAVIPTNEELAICRDTVASCKIIKKNRAGCAACGKRSTVTVGLFCVHTKKECVKMNMCNNLKN